MPIYEISAPNGKTYRIEGPEGASQEDIQAEVLRQFPDASGGLDSGETGVPEGQVVIGYGTNEDGSRFPMYGPPEDQPFAVKEREGLARGIGTAVEGLSALPGMVINPMGQALYDATGYGDHTYDVGDILRGAVGLPQMEEGVGRTVGEFASGGLGASAAARGANALLQYGPGVTTSVLNVLGRTPIRDAAAGAGAGLGMEYGGDVGNALAGDTGRAVGEAAGALAGGVAGYGAANRGFKQIAGRRVLNERAQAAQDLGIDQIAADVGGIGSRFATGSVRATFGGIPIAEGAENAARSAGRAADNVAGKIGRVSDNTGAGQAVRRGVERFEGGSLERATEIYEAIPIDAKAGVDLDSTRTALVELTQGFRSNKQLSALWANNPKLRATLEALTPEDVAGPARKDVKRLTYDLKEDQAALSRLRQSGEGSSPEAITIRARISDKAKLLQRAKRQSDRDPVGGELSWEDMKRFRSIVGEIVGQPGVTRDGSDIAQLRKLYAALSSDMEATARAQGPKAYQAWRRADQYWRGRQGRIDNVFASILGKDGLRSDEAVYEQVNRWAQDKGGDFARLARTIRSLPEDEANTVRATLVQRMGLANKGQQAGDGTIFSPGKFATEWQGMDSRAKAVLFPNAKHRADLEKLARVAEGMKGADQFRNWSGTAMGVNTFLQGGLALTNVPVAMALGAAQFGAGKLLASPKFARIMASTLELPAEKQGRVLSERLGVLASQEPALAGEVSRLQQALVSANDNVGISAVAEEPNQ